MGKGNINWAEPGWSPHRPREISHIPLTPRTPWQERWRSAETHGCGCSRSVSGTPHNSLQWKQDKKCKINFCKGQILGNIQSWWSNQAVSPHHSTVPSKHASKNTGVKSITYSSRGLVSLKLKEKFWGQGTFSISFSLSVPYQTLSSCFILKSPFLFSTSLSKACPYIYLSCSVAPAVMWVA